MPWGKIDDAFDEDPRVIRLLCEEGEPGVTAFGLWGLCFVWANRNTRRRGKQPGLLPHLLPMQKLGPHGMALAELLVKHELWARAGAEGAGWVILDFADTLPTKDLSSKRAEAGRRGAQKRWAAKRAAAAAAAAMANEAPDDGSLPSRDGKLLQPDGFELPGDGTEPGSAGSNAVLPDGYIRLPSVCHPATGENGGNEPSGDGILLPEVHPDGCVDNAEYGTLLSLDGSLPLDVGSLLQVGSKTAPQSQSPSQSQRKDSSPTDVGGVIAWPGSTIGKERNSRREDYTPEFECFWAAYGKRGTKRDAAREWHAALERGATVADIMAAVPAFVASTPELRFRTYAEKWLAGDGWESAVAGPVRAVAGGYSPGPYREPPESAYRHTRI